MTRVLSYPLLRAALSAALMLLAALSAHAAGVDTIVATVNGRAVTRSEVDRALERGRYSLMDGEARERALQGLIDRALLDQEASRLRVSVPEAELESIIDTVVQRSRSDRLTLRAEVERRGMTWEEYREELRGEVLRSRVFNLSIRNDPRWSGLTEDERLQDYYLRNTHLFRMPSVVRLLHLPGAPEERDALERVAAKVAEGVSFVDAAREALGREPSDTGEMTEEALSKVFRNALAVTPESRMAPLVEADGNLHLLLVAQRTPGRLLTFEEARDRVAERYAREGQQELFVEWLEELRKRAVIERRE